MQGWRDFLARSERERSQREAEKLTEQRKQGAIREAQRKRDAPALSLALTDGRVFGRALSCYLITRGDIRYTEDLAVRHTMQAAPNSSNAYSINQSFLEGVAAGERETVGPSDYGCQNYNAQARARVADYGGRLR